MEIDPATRELQRRTIRPLSISSQEVRPRLGDHYLVAEQARRAMAERTTKKRAPTEADATSASTGFKITTGASVSVIAVGRFS